MNTAIKKLSVIFLIVAMLVGAATVTASAREAISPEGDPLTYDVLPDGTLRVSDCESGQTDITIPSEVEGRAVTQIASKLFYNDQTLETLRFEDGCQIEIISNAFNDCLNLKSIDWGSGSSLKSISGSFQRCYALTELVIPASVQTIGEQSFSNCIALSTLTFAEGSQLTAIQKEAFAFTQKDNSMTPAAIETLTLPASLVTLEESAFHCIPVKHFALEPSSKLTEIPNGFLAADGDEGQPGVNTECKGVFDFVKRIFTPYESPFDYTPEGAAKACDCLESIDLGDKNSLSRIGIAAFKNQTHLTSVNFGAESVSSGLIIDGGAFAAVGNTALSDPEKPAAGIETLVFPSNLTEMDESAFLYARIKNIVFSDNCKLKNIGSGFLAIEGSDGAPMSDFNCNLDPDKPLALFTASNSLESIAFGKNNSLAEIRSGAFKNQSHLTSINFGTSDTELQIQHGAFAGAGNNAYLVDQNIDQTLTGGIKTLVFPSNLKSLGEGAFRFARIENLTFSENCQLEYIPYSFMTVEGADAQPANQTSWSSPSILNAANCLKTISFGKNNNLIEIRSGSFKNQSHLTSVDFGTSTKDLTLGYGVFVGAGNNAYLVDQNIDETLNEGIETLVFPSGLKSMGEGAFRYSRVKNIIFSDNNKLNAIPYAFMTVDGSDAGPGAGNSYKPDTDKPISILNAVNCLETVSFGKNNHLADIRSGSFKNQSHLTSIDFGTPAEDVSLKIGYGAFAGAGNNAYLVEQNIDTEQNDGIETLVFPSSLSSLSEGAFRYARIKNITFSDNSPISTLPYAFMTVDGSDAGPGADSSYKPDPDKSAAVLNAANCLESISFGKNNNFTNIYSGTVKNQSHLTSIDFGTSDKDLHISYGSFAGAGNNAYLVDQGIDETLNEGIETLVLPSNLEVIDEGAFRFARIKKIQFNDNCRLETLPYAFMTIDGNDGQPGDTYKPQSMVDAANCLVSVDFGKNNSLIRINSGSFKNQTHLSKIDFGSNADNSKRLSLQYGVFAGTAPATLTLPARISLDGSGQFKKAKIKHLIFEDGCMLTELNNGFLTKDYNDEQDEPVLETIDFGKNSSLKTIHSGVFAGNENLKTLDLSETKVETIQNGAFNDCGLTEIILPDTLKQVTEGSFQGLDDLTLLVIDGDNALTALEGGVFSNCDSLKTVNLLNSNITVIDDCLKENKNLKRVIFPEKLKAVTWTKPVLSDSYKEGKTEEEIKEIEAKTCPFYECGNVNRLWFAAKDPDGYTFDDDVFQFLNESGIVYVPKGTSDSNIEAYKTKLTAAGLTFGEEKWKIKEYIPVTEVTLDKDTAKVKVGKTITLTATVKPDDASVPKVTWSSSDPEIATVDKNGTVTGVSKGKAVITAVTKDGSVSAACTVTVKEPAPAITFTDVKPTDYFYDAVLWAVANGVTNGVTDQLFDPEGSCTRAQAMTFLWRAYDCPEVSTDHSFTDVKKGSYYEDAICWAVANNITTGTSETTFSPNEKCTRGQIVTFLYRAAKAEPVTIANPFTDVAEDAYYYNPVLWAVKNEITNGTSATTFSPENQASTRAQIVTFIYRYMKGVEI